MFESLHIDFSQDPLSQKRKGASRSFEAMDMDMDNDADASMVLSSTQPEMAGGLVMDWDTPHLASEFSSTQPAGKQFSSQGMAMSSHLEDEPSMSQFSQQPSVPVSRTQNAQKFQDIIPSRSMTRFYSAWELKLLVPLICEALHRLGVPVPSIPAVTAGDSSAMIRVIAKDGRMCPLQGKVLIECVSEGVFEVEFVKIKGDPLEWRRFFKKVVILCKDAVFKPDE
jgi:serine/threonine-protein kinase Chk1